MGDQTPNVLLFRLAESAYHTTLTKDYGRTSTYGYVTSSDIHMYSYVQTIYIPQNQTHHHLKTVSTGILHIQYIEASVNDFVCIVYIYLYEFIHIQFKNHTTKYGYN